MQERIPENRRGFGIVPFSQRSARDINVSARIHIIDENTRHLRAAARLTRQIVSDVAGKKDDIVGQKVGENESITGADVHLMTRSSEVSLKRCRVRSRPGIPAISQEIARTPPREPRYQRARKRRGAGGARRPQCIADVDTKAEIA